MFTIRLHQREHPHDRYWMHAAQFYAVEQREDAHEITYYSDSKAEPVTVYVGPEANYDAAYVMNEAGHTVDVLRARGRVQARRAA